MARYFDWSIEENITTTIGRDRPLLLASMRKIVGGRGKWAKTWIRRAVIRAGYGDKVGNAVRSSAKDIPDGVQVVIYSKAKVQHAGGTFDLIALFQRDLYISPLRISAFGADATFIAYPNRKVIDRPSRFRRLPVPGDYGDDFFIAKVTPYGGALVPRDDPDSAPWFWLVPYTKQHGRLSLDGLEPRLKEDLGPRIVRDWRQKRTRVQLERFAA